MQFKFDGQDYPFTSPRRVVSGSVRPCNSAKILVRV